MKERERDRRDEEMLRLKAKLGEVTMANELLERKIAALEFAALWAAGSRDDEPGAVPGDRPGLRPRHGHPRLAPPPRHVYHLRVAGAAAPPRPARPGPVGACSDADW